jgi:hypothetical protein
VRDCRVPPDKSGLARTMGVEGEENKRAGQETRDCFVAGFCDDAALKLKRTLNGKSSMLLCHHKLFCRRACQILRGRGCQGKQYRESRNSDTTDR